MDTSEQVDKFKEFIESQYMAKIHSIMAKGGMSLVIDFAELSKFDPDLAELVLEQPDDLIRAAEIAIEQFDLNRQLFVRIRNLPNSQNIIIRDIRKHHLNKLIFFEGLVRQSSDIRPQVTLAKFECPACGNTINVPQIDQKFKEPTRCSCGRKGHFRLLSKEMVDTQRLLIEELTENLEGNAQPKRLAVFLRDDMVEPKMEQKTTPGSKTRVIGLVKEVPIRLPSGGISTRFDLVIEANNIEPLQEDFGQLELIPEEEQRIKEMSQDPKIYNKLVNSIAPSILGHERIKEALMLQLMGGVRKIKDDGTIIRGDLHILLIGDPGSGKSAMSMFISKAAPKARYISGIGASSAGLTASVVKDEFLKGWALEAGAIVLANKGILVVDEMDKMTVEETSALHEGLEQQTITIAKANIQATLKCETTVLAAANPKFGRFDPYKSVAEQINLPPALINRFDLIFPVKDIPDKIKDDMIAQHILNQEKSPETSTVDIPVELLRKYISYAKQKIRPVLTDSAVKQIKEFYVNLRNRETSSEEGLKSIPISARQLEALVRLSEASAMTRLSTKVTREDAKRAISLLKVCLNQVGIDPETGKIDIDRISTGITTSTRNKLLIIMDIISQFEANGKKTIPIDEIIAEAENKKINETVAKEIIDKLKREGELYEPKQGFIQKI